MLPKLSKIKGIHPGVILRRELKAQNLKGSDLAVSIDEHKQTISAILNKRRAINPQLSIKLSKQFNVDEDYFMLLQASFDVKKVLESQTNYMPNIDNIRKIIFWDTDVAKIDWYKSRKYVIKRILERGNQKEINEIISFYGKQEVIKQIKKIKISRLPSFENNLKKFDLI